MAIYQKNKILIPAKIRAIYNKQYLLYIKKYNTTDQFLKKSILTNYSFYYPYYGFNTRSLSACKINLGKYEAWQNSNAHPQMHLVRKDTNQGIGISYKFSWALDQAVRYTNLITINNVTPIIYEQGTIENGDLVVYFACADSNHNDLQIDNFFKAGTSSFWVFALAD